MVEEVCSRTSTTENKQTFSPGSDAVAVIYD
jgi:hypothetical protein